MSHTGVGLREEPLCKGNLGAWDLGPSRNHLSSFIYYAFNAKLLSTISPRTKTRRSYICLAIDVARYESKDLAIATPFRQEVVIVRRLSVTCYKYHPEKRGL